MTGVQTCALPIYSLEIESANQSFSIGTRQMDVKGDFIVGTGYARPMLPGSSKEVAVIYQLPIDGTLPGTYFGSNSTTWGKFTYVSVPEAGLFNSSTAGTGNTTVSIAENTNYSYTMNVVHYQNPSPENEQTINHFLQQWRFTEDGTLVIPSSGSNLAIEFSGKSVANVSNILFANGTTQVGAALPLANLKSIVAVSTDFNDFKSRIAAL